MTYVDMKYNPTNTRVWVRNMSYSAWGSARLLVLFIRAMRRPQGVGRATVRLSRFFLYYPIAVEVSPKSFAITMQILRNIKVSLYTELLYLPSATQTKLLNHPMPIKGVSLYVQLDLKLDCRALVVGWNGNVAADRFAYPSDLGGKTEHIPYILYFIHHFKSLHNEKRFINLHLDFQRSIFLCTCSKHHDLCGRRWCMYANNSNCQWKIL